MIGETFGSYRVTAKLGEGGMGAVFLAEHPLIGRKVAIKVLLAEHSQREELVTRFFNEARAVASLRHPALIDVFDFGTHAASGSAYIVMDYLEGESLAARLERAGRLPAEVALDLAWQAAKGVEAAHDKNIVHRDLKPDNIFLTRDPTGGARDLVKVLDFGIAKLAADASAKDSKGATRTGTILGTPHYMSPEQCRGSGQVDHRADIYSMGCVLYAMLCGRPPFPFEGVGEIIGAHLHAPVPPPRSIEASVPEAVEAVVMRALEKDPARRQQTMGELAAALEGALGAPAGTPGVAASSLAGTPVVPRPAAAITARGSLALVPGGAPPPTGVPMAAIATAPTTFSTAVGEAAPTLKRGMGLPGVLGLAVGGIALAAIGVVAWRLVGARPAAEPAAPTTPPSAMAPLAGGPSGAPMAAAPAAAEPPSSGPGATPAAPAPGIDPGARAEQAIAPVAAPVDEQIVPGAAAGEGGAPPGAGGAPAAPAPTGEAAARAPRAPRQVAPRPASADAAYDRAVAHAAAGRDADALQSFRALLRAGGLSSAQRTAAERYAIGLARRVAEIEVLCDLAGAEVVIDGRPRGRTPLRDGILVAPGTHELVVSRAGYQTVRKQVQVRAGERKAFSFRLPR